MAFGKTDSKVPAPNTPEGNPEHQKFQKPQGMTTVEEPPTKADGENDQDFAKRTAEYEAKKKVTTGEAPPAPPVAENVEGKPSEVADPAAKDFEKTGRNHDMSDG